MNNYSGTVQTPNYAQAAQQTSYGNLQGAQTATAANRVNQNTPYGNLNYSQSVDANGNPTWTANQTLSQPLQDLTQSSLQGLQASQNNPMYGINPGQTYSDAIMQRLQPQMAQSAESNKAALANQGIVPGTQAYDNAMRTFNQGQNDLLTSAQINGMQTGLQAQQLQGNQASQIKSLATPNYVNPSSQAAVAGPDYMGAMGLYNQGQVANQNVQNAGNANLQNGLFGLAGAGLMNPNVTSGIGGLVTQLPSLFGSSGNVQTGSPFTGSQSWMNTVDWTDPSSW